MNCKDCRFFLRKSTHSGECRKLAPRRMVGELEPQAHSPFDAAWPDVDSDDGCGEFERKAVAHGD